MISNWIILHQIVRCNRVLAELKEFWALFVEFKLWSGSRSCLNFWPNLASLILCSLKTFHWPLITMWFFCCTLWLDLQNFSLGKLWYDYSFPLGPTFWVSFHPEIITLFLLISIFFPINSLLCPLLLLRMSDLTMDQIKYFPLVKRMCT